MIPWLGIAFVGGISAVLTYQKTIKYLVDKKTKSDAELKVAKQELNRGIREFDKNKINIIVNRDIETINKLLLI
ncbi:MAG: hypothetical protein VB122_03210 [Erysipelotrichales bacterium]|nr:hypothetical protein [Erysipelotrichales bacterium]